MHSVHLMNVIILNGLPILELFPIVQQHLLIHCDFFLHIVHLFQLLDGGCNLHCEFSLLVACEVFDEDIKFRRLLHLLLLLPSLHLANNQMHCVGVLYIIESHSLFVQQLLALKDKGDCFLGYTLLQLILILYLCNCCSVSDTYSSSDRADVLQIYDKCISFHFLLIIIR